MKAAETQNASTVVTKGLAVGDQVVVNGQYRLQDGARVEIRPLAAQANGDAS